jgi:hypothetical protein
MSWMIVLRLRSSRMLSAVPCMFQSIVSIVFSSLLYFLDMYWLSALVAPDLRRVDSISADISALCWNKVAWPDGLYVAGVGLLHVWIVSLQVCVMNVSIFAVSALIIVIGSERVVPEIRT